MLTRTPQIPAGLALLALLSAAPPTAANAQLSDEDLACQRVTLNGGVDYARKVFAARWRTKDQCSR